MQEDTPPQTPFSNKLISSQKKQQYLYFLFFIEQQYLLNYCTLVTNKKQKTELPVSTKVEHSFSLIGGHGAKVQHYRNRPHMFYQDDKHTCVRKSQSYANYFMTIMSVLVGNMILVCLHHFTCTNSHCVLHISHR